MKTLVTGACGASGKVLVKLLRENGINKVFTCDVVSDGDDPSNLCDLSAFPEVVTLLETCRPDRIFHLAGSFTNDYETDYRSNVLATKNLLDGILMIDPKTRVLLIGSAAEYGRIPPEMEAVHESHELRPVSVYGLSKAMQTLLAAYYVDRFDLDLVIARTFNLLGPNLSPRLFIGSLYKQILEYKNGEIDKIKLNQLIDSRDYITIEEAAACYINIMEHGKKREIYNVGSGVAIRIQTLLLQLLAENNLSMDAVTFVEGAESKATKVCAEMKKYNEMILSIEN
jgi:nucleoside-diphosphate-sugar epimerase